MRCHPAAARCRSIIGEFQTKVAPYDIREGFFQGGVINAVLTSGTNDFQGTGFFTYSSDNLQGKQTKPYLVGQTGGTTADGHVIPPIPSYTSKDYGLELSGPLLKDRLFFMVAGERVRANLPFNLAGSTITSTVFDQITGIAKTKYGVDAAASSPARATRTTASSAASTPISPMGSGSR